MVIGMMIFIFGLWFFLLAVLVRSIISKMAGGYRKRRKERLVLGEPGVKMPLYKQQFSSLRKDGANRCSGYFFRPPSAALR